MFKQLSESEQEFVKELLGKMTLEEKIGQTNQTSLSFAGGFTFTFDDLMKMVEEGKITLDEIRKMTQEAELEYPVDDIRTGLVGSVMARDAKKANELQRIAMEESRLGIPLLIGFDVIHGYYSVYPIALAEAGAFEPELFEETARMAARESRANGIVWHYAPMIDVARDARWGRVSEGPGEDPYLGSVFARAKVRGFQNNRDGSYVAACPKHYIAYGACEGGLDYNTTNVSNSLLYNAYLPPFKAAVEEGAATVMASFNDLNGIPLTVNKFALRQVLKEKLGFSGFVVSDASAIRECVVHGIAADEYDAGVQAINAGVDMDMATDIYKNHLSKAVAEGHTTMEVLDEAVCRILSVKKWLGLFENPYVDEDTANQFETLPDEHIKLALESAQKSIVLLKNENNILPLSKDAKISVVGALASKPEEVVGAWALNWRAKDCVPILDGIKSVGQNVKYFPCCGPQGDVNQDEVDSAIAEGDVIVAVVGETSSMSGESKSRADIGLPGKQKELLEKLIASGKPVVAVLMNGRPLALSWEDQHVPAILECWHLGIQMGNAVASVLFGDHNPGGKLSSTFPRLSGQCPIYYNHPNTGRPGRKIPFTASYIDCGFEPLYPFGYGLSYTEFAYNDFTLASGPDRLTASVKVANTGDRKGSETVQLYMRDVTASIVRPVKELKGFKKICLEPGEEETVVIELFKSDMGFYNDAGEYLLEDGIFHIFMGGNSRDCLMAEVELEF